MVDLVLKHRGSGSVEAARAQFTVGVSSFGTKHASLSVPMGFGDSHTKQVTSSAVKKKEIALIIHFFVKKNDTKQNIGH